MTAPAVIVRFELEAAPVVFCDWVDSYEEERILDWLLSHPKYYDLIHAAQELERRERAA